MKNPDLQFAIGEIQKSVELLRKQYNSDSLNIYIACSGGADSLALAVAAFACKNSFNSLSAIIIDHGIQNESSKIAAQTRNTLRKIGYENIFIEKINIKTDSNIENIARELRYEKFSQIIAGDSSARKLASNSPKLNSASELPEINVIFTGHTLNDEAEGVLLGLARGSGIKSISGIAPLQKLKGPTLRYSLETDYPSTSDDTSAGTLKGRTLRVFLARPFLKVNREQTEQICQDAKITFWKDPTNGERGIRNPNLPLRSRIRNEIMPILEDIINPQIVKSLEQTSQIAREQSDFFETEISEQTDLILTNSEVFDSKLYIRITTLESLHPAICKGIIKKIADSKLKNQKQGLTKSQIDTIYDFISNWHGQKDIAFKNLSIGRSSKMLVFTQN